MVGTSRRMKSTELEGGMLLVEIFSPLAGNGHKQDHGGMKFHISLSSRQSSSI